MRFLFGYFFTQEEAKNKEYISNSSDGFLDHTETLSNPNSTKQLRQGLNTYGSNILH